MTGDDGLPVSTLVSAIITTLLRAFVALDDDEDSAYGLVTLVLVLRFSFPCFVNNCFDLQGYIVWIYLVNWVHNGLEAVLLN